MTKLFEEALFTRRALVKILETFSVEQLNRIPPQFNNSIFWNVAHLLVTPQLLLYKRSGLNPNISDDQVIKYAKGSRPETAASTEEIEEVKDQLINSMHKIEEDYRKGVFQNYDPYETSTGIELTNIEDAIRFSAFHDGIHLGVIMSLKKLV